MFAFLYRYKKLRGIILFLLFAAAVVLLTHRGGAFISADAENRPDVRSCVDFLHTFGWEVDVDGVAFARVRIPLAFDSVLTEYNALQRTQGFDLEPYCGEEVLRLTFPVTNYPGAPENAPVYANCYLSGGDVIGGDICDISIDGFLHGFSERIGETNDQTG